MSKKKRLLLAVTVLALIAGGVVLASPYPRQFLFGPKIHGVPLCAWQEDVRRKHAEHEEKTFVQKVLEWLKHGRDREMEWEELTKAEREDVYLSLIDDPSNKVRIAAAEQLSSKD